MSCPGLTMTDSRKRPVPKVERQPARPPNERNPHFFFAGFFFDVAALPLVRLFALLEDPADLPEDFFDEAFFFPKMASYPSAKFLVSAKPTRTILTTYLPRTAAGPALPMAEPHRQTRGTTVS